MTTSYNVGTVTVANGGTTVTGVGTSWVGKIFEGDLFTDPAQGVFARVTADALSNTSLTINAWPGTGLTAEPYEVLLQADSIRTSERTRQLLEQMSVVEANGRGLFYRFSDSVTDADPSSGYLRLNNVTIGSATAGYLDNLDANGATVADELDTWDDSTSTIKGKLWLRAIADPASFHAFSITGSVVDGTGYRKLTLAYIGGSGSFAADDELMAFFVPKGDAGNTGDAGVGGITVTFDSSTADADPGVGEFRLNHATHSSATAAYIDNVEALAGASITSLLDSWDDGQSTIKGTLTISAKADPAIFRIYNVTGLVVDGTGYRKLTIAYVTGAGTLTNTTSCSLQFARAGNAGFTPGFRVAFSTTTTDSDPGAGVVRFNHATFASITQIFVDNADQGGAAITAWLDGLDDVVNANARAYLSFQNVDDPTIYAEFAVTGTVTDGTGYRKIPVSPIVGVVPANGVVLAMSAAKSGADGAGTGDVVGPASAVADRIAVNNGTTGKLLKDGGKTIAEVMQDGVIGGRLSLVSGDPLPEADTVGASTVYLVPSYTNYTSLYIGSQWVPFQFSQLSLSLVASHLANNNYDVWEFNDAGSLNIGTGPSWLDGAVAGSAIARGTGAASTELEVFQGRLVNKVAMTLRNGATTYSVGARECRLRGAIRMTANGVTEDSKAKRLVSNVYNPDIRTLLKIDTTDTWAYSTATWRQARAAADNQVEVLHVVSGRIVKAEVNSNAYNSTSTARNVAVGIGIDSATVNSAQRKSGAVLLTLIEPLNCWYTGYPGLGYHALKWLEIGTGTDTQTWCGDFSGTFEYFQSGIAGETLA